MPEGTACAFSKPKSVLMTPDPYHTPGYGGFCPQFKYQIGQTFGRTTSRLLTDNDVASSGRLVLADTAPNTTCDDQSRKGRLDLIRTRTQSWGDQKLDMEMVPGYTGFIPKSQHYFGKRYAVNSINAISDFEGEQRGHSKKIRQLRMTEALQSGKILPKDTKDTPMPEITAKYSTPLKPISRKAQPFISQSTPQHTRSPYFMENDNQHKRYMSGYTGFVPRSRELLGMGYPLITHHALNDFTDEVKRLECSNRKPIQIHRNEVAKANTAIVYPVDMGLVPHYTGHIPGEKFRYGNTFGHSTKNAMHNRSVTA